MNGQKADVIVTSDGFADWPTEVAGIRSLGNNTPILNSWAGDGTFWYPKNPKVTNYWYVTYGSVFGDDPSAPVKALIAKMAAKKQAPATGGFLTGAAAIDGIVAAIKRAGGSTNGAKLAGVMEKFKNVADDLRAGQLLACAAQRLRTHVPRDGGAGQHAQVRGLRSRPRRPRASADLSSWPRRLRLKRTGGLESLSGPPASHGRSKGSGRSGTSAWRSTGTRSSG